MKAIKYFAKATTTNTEKSGYLFSNGYFVSKFQINNVLYCLCSIDFDFWFPPNNISWLKDLNFEAEEEQIFKCFGHYDLNFNEYISGNLTYFNFKSSVLIKQIDYHYHL
jgi:hypothetical protein